MGNSCGSQKKEGSLWIYRRMTGRRVEKEQTGDRDWKVTFEGGFYGQRGRRGIEIPVGKTFSWGKEIWHVPAVYQCGKGGWWQISLETDPNG